MSSLTSSPIYMCLFMNKRKSEVIFVHQNLISNWLTYLVHAKSTGELSSFGFSDHSVRSLVSAKRSANRWECQMTSTFWLIFGLSPNLRLSKTLSERLIPKVKGPNVPTTGTTDNASSSSFLACNSRLCSTIRRHHPPQRAVLSQICCFGELKVFFQILLDGAEPRDAGMTWLSSSPLKVRLTGSSWHLHCRPCT